LGRFVWRLDYLEEAYFLRVSWPLWTKGPKNELFCSKAFPQSKNPAARSVAGGCKSLHVECAHYKSVCTWNVPTTNRSARGMCPLQIAARGMCPLQIGLHVECAHYKSVCTWNVPTTNRSARGMCPLQIAVRGMCPLQISLHPLGMCKISKHADKPAKNVQRRAAPPCCLRWTSVVGNIFICSIFCAML